MQILYNGKVVALDDNNNIYEAIGIEDGIIKFLGSSKDAISLEGKEKIDLEGKLILPGFIDSHLHCINYTFVESSVKLFDCSSIRECLDLVKARLAENPNLKWIYARGWNDDSFVDSNCMTKDEIDAISMDIPIVMVRVCGHVAVSNSKGLEALKTLPEFQEIEKDIDFETGFLRENAVQYYYSILDKPSKDMVENFIKVAMKDLNEKGITGLHSDDLGSLPGKDWRLIIDSFRSLDEKNEMTVRFYEQCLFEKNEELKEFLKEGHRTGDGGAFFTIGPVKILNDGSLGARTAALIEGYEDDKENLGVAVFTQDELNEIVDTCDKNNMQVAIHGIGDRSIETIIDAFENSSKLNLRKDARHGVVHAQITNQSIFERMLKNQLLAYIQPVFVGYDMDIVKNRVGEKRAEKAYAWKTMLDMGIKVLGGSDAPVESFDILENIQYAVTREKLSGGPDGGWMPEEKLCVDESVKLFTNYPAYGSFTEKVNGTLEIGKRADMVVLEQDIYEVPENTIKDVKVVMTIVGGKTVFEKL